MKLKKLTFEISGKEIELTGEEFEELRQYILAEYRQNYPYFYTYTCDTPKIGDPKDFFFNIKGSSEGVKV